MKRIRRDMPSILPKLDLLMNQTDSDSTGKKMKTALYSITIGHARTIILKVTK